MSKRDSFDIIFKEILLVPRIFELDRLQKNGDPFPVFLKPECGYGSRDTFIAQSKNEVVFFLDQNPSLIIMEYLPGKEYTVECF